MRMLACGLAAIMLSGCAMLTAEAPLFSPADQDPAFRLEEGLWAYRAADCRADPRRARPGRKSCLDWARLVRNADGSWRVESVGEDDEAPMRFVIVPATAREGDARAPLYVAEATNEKEASPSYAAVIPRGEETGPVRRLSFVAIACGAVLRDGTPPDIVVARGEDGAVTGCVAKTKDAVRDATRRAVIDALPTLGEEELVWVR